MSTRMLYPFVFTDIMNKRISVFLLSLFTAVAVSVSFGAPSALQKEEDKIHQEEAAAHEEEDKLDVKEVIFHHLGDGYGWEVPFSHVYRIPLPVIVRAEDGTWHSFSSGKLTEVEVIKDLKTGKESEELIPVIHHIEKNGKTYDFAIAHVSSHKNKVVQVFPLSAEEEAKVKAQAQEIAAREGTDAAETPVDGYLNFEGRYYREYKPFDISITKNVLALLFASAFVTFIVMMLVRHYRKYGFKTPRKGLGFFELLVDFIYTGVIKQTLGKKAAKFAPYLLTCFFFILTMNLFGLIVIFPGGANLTGNIAITLILAVMTFVMTNVFGTKHYWKEIFWPDVPLFLKFPLPIMQLIEVFGIFTKPAALCVRLFANMMGGHMIVITLTLLIFIFAAFGAAAAGTATVVSVFFSIFMLLLDVLVSFIQAYVFTLLSAMFISMAQESGHAHKDAEGHEQEPAVEA